MQSALSFAMTSIVYARIVHAQRKCAQRLLHACAPMPLLRTGRPNDKSCGQNCCYCIPAVVSLLPSHGTYYRYLRPASMSTCVRMTVSIDTVSISLYLITRRAHVLGQIKGGTHTFAIGRAQ